METRTKVALGLLVVGAFVFSRRGAVGSSNVRPLAQGDSRWGNLLVGNGSSPYKATGCVVTCVTMVVNALTGASLTPDHLRPGIMLTSAEYAGGAILSEQAFARLGCVVRNRIRDSRDVSAMCALIDDTLSKGGLAVVRVDYDLSTPEDNHSVVCFAHDGTGYKCADPANGSIITLSHSLFLQKPSKTYNATGVQPVFRA